jgi:hypothetical protein
LGQIETVEGVHLEDLKDRFEKVGDWALGLKLEGVEWSGEWEESGVFVGRCEEGRIGWGVGLWKLVFSLVKTFEMGVEWDENLADRELTCGYS